MKLIYVAPFDVNVTIRSGVTAGYGHILSHTLIYYAKKRQIEPQHLIYNLKAVPK